MNSFVRTATTVVIAAGLFGYIYLVESNKDLKDGSSGQREKVFAGLDKLKVKSIVLKKRDGAVVEAEKTGESWALVSPLQTGADSGQIGSLLDALQGLQTEEIVSENVSDLAPFGLAEPKVTVSVVAEGAARPFEFELGDDVPAGSALFARVPGQPRVFTVSSTLENTLSKSAFDLRDRSLLKVKKDDIQWFEVVEKGKVAFKLARGGEGEDGWNVEAPVITRAARWTVEGFLGLVENLRMESVASEQATTPDLAKHGLGRGARRLVLGLDESNSATLEIGSRTEDGKYFARDASSTLIATIDPGVVGDLDKGLKNLRAARLLEVATYDVTAFDVTSGGATRTFTKSTTKGKDGVEEIGWKSTAPVKDATHDQTSNAFFSVGAIDATEFIDEPRSLAAYGLDAPALRVVLRFDGAKKEDWFEVALVGEAAFGRRLGDASILELDKAKTEELIQAFATLGS